MERTFALVKPEGVARGLVPEILTRIARKGHRVVGMKLTIVSRETAAKHYAEHEGKPFFEDIVAGLSSGPVLCLALESENAILGWRAMMGATNPAEAAAGTIRGDFATAMPQNVVHGSDGPASAERELGIFFAEGELLP